MDNAKFKTGYVLSYIIAALTILASVVGLLFSNVYRENDFVKSTWFANDLMTLIVAVPLLVLGLYLTQRGSVRGLLIWLAMLGYVLYNYAFYLFGTAFNRLFLVYVALFSLSILALIFSLPRVNAGQISQKFRARTPVRWISVFMLFFAVSLGGIWIAMSLGTVFTGQPPQVLEKFDHPTAVVFALDLGLLIPGILLGAVLLWQRQPWGYIVATIMNLKAVTYALALVVSSFYSFAATGVADAFLPLYITLGTGNLIASVLLLGNVRSAQEEGKVRTQSVYS